MENTQKSLRTIEELKILLSQIRPEGRDNGMVQKSSDGSQTNSHSPLDYQSFSDRLHSFTVKNWHKMPTELSPLICASKGWRYLKDSTLICDFCKQDIFIALPSRQQEFYVRKVDYSVGQLTEKHLNCCPWVSVQCPEYFLRNELPGEKSHQDRVIAVAAELTRNTTMSDFLSNQVFKVAESITQNQDSISRLSDMLKLSPQCLLVCLHGWKVITVTNLVLLHCDVCKRRIGITNKSVDLTNHLAWCPWISAVGSKDRPLIHNVLHSIQDTYLQTRKRSSTESDRSGERYRELKEMRSFFKKSVSTLSTS